MLVFIMELVAAKIQNDNFKRQCQNINSPSDWHTQG